MKPIVDGIGFGSITINGQKMRHDVIVRLDGTVERRKKELTKEIYGTSHHISLAEAEYVYEEGAELLIVGAGRFGRIHLSDEAERYFEERNCRTQLLPNNQVVRAWNQAQGKVIGLFHLTC
ncbi:MAG: Mth938-like domain-containing protein [Anaerolineae bacterium]